MQNISSFLLAGLLVVSAAAPRSHSDVGYEGLFTDSLDEFNDPSYRLPLNGSAGIPSYMRGSFGGGSFIQVGPARWCWNKRCMTHGLDGYSKLYRYTFMPDGTVGFGAQFLQSGFLAQSKKANDIVFNVMAQPTDPPLKMGMSTFMNAANDNNNVNVFRLGDQIEVLSDTPTTVDIAMDTLNATQEHNTMGCHTGGLPCNKLTGDTTPIAQLAVGGSAHPFKMPNGDYVGLLEAGKVMKKMPGNERMVVYRRSASSPNQVQELVKINVKESSYSHSFGLALGVAGEEDHVIVIDQPLHYNLMGLMSTGTLQTGLELEKNVNTMFHVAPMKAGAQSLMIEGPRFFFGHVVNTFSYGNGTFVIDINAQESIFFNRYNMSVQHNKTARDTWPIRENQGAVPGYMTVTRYEINTETKSVTHKPLFGRLPKDNIQNEHDLFKLHPADLGRPYCGYWAFQSFYNSTSFGSQAIIRTELCGKEPVVAAAWHRPNVYPGEATFVPKPGSNDKTEGTLVFKALDGNTGNSLLIVCDARTMKTITEAVLPIHVPFTVHGDWFAA